MVPKPFVSKVGLFELELRRNGFFTWFMSHHRQRQIMARNSANLAHFLKKRCTACTKSQLRHGSYFQNGTIAVSDLKSLDRDTMSDHYFKGRCSCPDTTDNSADIWMIVWTAIHMCRQVSSNSVHVHMYRYT
jgi:hypothetical protein